MRPKMDVAQRAKQFLPFAALKGYEEALRAKERIVVPKAMLSEEMKEELDQVMQQLKKLDLVTVVYFFRDSYCKQTAVVTRIDRDARILQVAATKIPFDDIYRLELAERY